MKTYIGESIFANLFRGRESVGGKIFFYDDKLIFKSNDFKLRTGITEIKYSDILEVNKRNTIGIIPNGVTIVDKNKLEYKFVIYNRENVIRFLKSQI